MQVCEWRFPGCFLGWLIIQSTLQVVFLGGSDISVHTEASGGETLTSAGISVTLQIFFSLCLPLQSEQWLKCLFFLFVCCSRRAHICSLHEKGGYQVLGYLYIHYYFMCVCGWSRWLSLTLIQLNHILWVICFAGKILFCEVNVVHKKVQHFPLEWSKSIESH